MKIDLARSKTGERRVERPAIHGKGKHAYLVLREPVDLRFFDKFRRVAGPRGLVDSRGETVAIRRA